MSGNAGDRPRADQSSEAPASPGLREVLGAWAICAVVALAILATYARIPPRELYNVDDSGVVGGLGRMLVALNWPAALIALGVLALVTERRPRPLLAVPALLLCVLIVVPGVIEQSDLDAEWINAFPALGVALVGLMTVLAWREGGLGVHGSPRGDRVRIGAFLILLAVSLPWIFAELGVYVGDVPGLRSVFMSKEIYQGEAAVHLGEHHGFVGGQIVAAVLLLSRQLVRMRPSALRELLAVYLCGLFAYGAANIANDAWGEQIFKRGWTDYRLPSVVRPSQTWLWLVILGATAALYLGVWRRNRVG
jgi:hypothetical protein